MKTVAIVQARMGSTRLPGKVLRALGPRSVLGHVVERVRRSPWVDDVVVAVPEGTGDDPVADEARRLGAAVFRGSEQDVLSRYHGAASAAGAEVVVRVTSDCPLFDSDLLTEMLERFRTLRAGDGVDYLSNTVVRTYPRGLDAEVFTREALERAHREAAQPYEREHVTPYLYGHPEAFRLVHHTGAEDLSHHRWTLDTDEDWAFMDAVFEACGGGGSPSTAEVLSLLARRPEIAALNADVPQKPLTA